MSEYITLLGAEDVARAGRQMASAADDMQRAASSISESLDMSLRRFEELVERLERLNQERGDG